MEITGKDLAEIRPEGRYGDAKPFRSVEEFLNAGKATLIGEQAKRSKEAKSRFLEMLMFPEFHVMSDSEKAEALDVDPVTLKKWLIQCPDEYLAEALRTQRERHARNSFKVDSALMKQCQEGNVKAMDLYYRRIEGWVPKQDMELTRGRDKELDGKANFELMKALFEGLTPEQKAALTGTEKPKALEGGMGEITEEKSPIYEIDGGGEGD